MEINGIPLHPLVVHAAVVFDPLAALLAGTYGVRPTWRWALRWPALVAAVGGALATWLAGATGENLKEHLIQVQHENPGFIADHEKWAGLLQAGMWVLAGLTVIAWWALPYVTRIRDAADREARLGPVAKVLPVLLPLVGLTVIVLCYLTGDAGAKSVWSG